MRRKRAYVVVTIYEGKYGIDSVFRTRKTAKRKQRVIEYLYPDAYVLIKEVLFYDK